MFFLPQQMCMRKLRFVCADDEVLVLEGGWQKIAKGIYTNT